MLRDKKQREINSIIYKEGKVYVPKNEKLRVEIIRLYHNTPVEGHREQQKTVELVMRNFWQPGVTKKMKQYIERCDSYQRNKNCTEQLVDKLMPNSIPEKPQSHISADFITKLLLAQGYNSILVVVDRLTKMAYFISTMEKISAEKLARLFRDNMQKYERAEKFVIKMKEVQKEAKVVLGKVQEKIKKYADRKRGEVNEYKVGDLVILSTKNLKYQIVRRRTEKLTEKFVGPYKIKKIILTNIVELELPSTVRIYPVVNISRICKYIGQVEEQKKKQPALVIIGEEEQEVEKILNKQQIREKDKYLVWWKGFTADSDTWEGIENLENTKEVVEEFEREY